MVKFQKSILLSGLFERLAIYKLIRLLKGNYLLVLNYHRLYEGALITEFDKDVFEHSAETFEQHLKFVKKNFDVVSEKDVLEMVESRRIKGKCVLFTFDDGYIDNYTIAFPLLKAYDVPAIFFIPTQSINDRKLGWWDIISYLIKKTDKTSIVLNNNTFYISTLDKRQKAIDYSISFIKRTPFDKCRFFIHEISRECEVPIPSHDLQSSQLMRWEQIEDIAANGIAVGSHTHSHRILSGLTQAQQMRELQSSKETLEQRLGHTIRTLSYPVGGYSHFSNITKKLAKNAGYEFCFSYNTGLNKDRISDRFDVKRFSLSNDVRLMQGELYLPRLFVHCCR